MTDASRRGSVHTVQGFWLSILPQTRQTVIFSLAASSALASGIISCSRFLMRCNAARRAERGPRPGRRASNWIRRSISGPAIADGIRSEQLQARRQRQAAGQALHLFLQDRLGLAACVGMRGHDQILEDLRLVRLE